MFKVFYLQCLVFRFKNINLFHTFLGIIIIAMCTSATSRPTLTKLQRFVITPVATKWHELGHELLPNKENELKIIQSDCKNDSKRSCIAMFTLWLDTKSDANWYQIVGALKSPSVDLNSVAADIENIFRGM